jgi:hypothetical protein
VVTALYGFSGWAAGGRISRVAGTPGDVAPTPIFDAHLLAGPMTETGLFAVYLPGTASVSATASPVGSGPYRPLLLPSKQGYRAGRSLVGGHVVHPYTARTPLPAWSPTAP